MNLYAVSEVLLSYRIHVDGHWRLHVEGVSEDQHEGLVDNLTSMSAVEAPAKLKVNSPRRRAFAI
jgi:hypothetical protein